MAETTFHSITLPGRDPARVPLTAIEFNPQTNYKVRDYCTYQGILYRCIETHSAGTWDSTKNYFTTANSGTNVGDELTKRLVVPPTTEPASTDRRVGDLWIDTNTESPVISVDPQPVAGSTNVPQSGGTFNAIQSVENRKANKTLLTGEFSPSSPYSVNNLCIHDGYLYRCKVDIPTGTAWDSSKWETTTIKDELARIESEEVDLDVIAETFGDSSSYAVGDYVLHTENGVDKLYRCTNAVSDTSLWNSQYWTEVKLADEVSDLKSALIDWANIVNNVQYYGIIPNAGGPGAVPSGTDHSLILYNNNSGSANYGKIIYWDGTQWANFEDKTINDLPEGYANQEKIANIVSDTNAIKTDYIAWANIVNNVQYYGLFQVEGGPGNVPAGTPTYMVGYNNLSASQNYKRIIYWDGTQWINFGTKTIDDLPIGIDAQAKILDIDTAISTNALLLLAQTMVIDSDPVPNAGGPTSTSMATADHNKIYYNSNTGDNYLRIMIYHNGQWVYIGNKTLNDLYLAQTDTLSEVDKTMMEQLYLRVGRDTFQWSIGTMDYTTGAYTTGLSSGIRVVSANSVYAKAGSKIDVDTGYKFAVFMYSSPVSDTTDFVDARNFAQTGAYVLDHDYYIRLGIGTVDNATLTDTDIKNHFQLVIIGESVKSNYGRRISTLEEYVGDVFTATFETVEPPSAIDKTPSGRLSLIASKRIVRNADIEPQNEGYLYVDETTQKLYYSANVYNRPEYLCDFDLTVSSNIPCQKWLPIITPEGDIIFLTQGKEAVRKNPIIYPHGDYDNPVVVDLSGVVTVLPSGMTTDSNYVVNTDDDFVLWGEYRQNGVSSYNGEPLRIWKLTPPYTNPTDWEVVHTFYYSNTGDPWGQDPNNEISHIHTVDYDFYNNVYYCNTGDKNEFCRVLASTDDGDTWTQIAHGTNDTDNIVSDTDVGIYGQKIRALGYIFTEDYIYWATDADYPYHNLYRCGRDGNGVADFSTTELVAECRHDYVDANNMQRVYNLCKTRNPDGLILFDRAEPRNDGKYVLEFYSFEKSKMFTVANLEVCNGDAAYRYGFGSEVSTKYQSVQENGIIVGGSSYDRRMSLNILNTTSTNRTGVTKVIIKQIA